MINSRFNPPKPRLSPPRNSIILEVRGTPLGYLEPSPFSWGTDELGIVFELSQGHTPDLTSCPEAHGCTIVKKYVQFFFTIALCLDC